MQHSKITYQQSGVDIDEGNKLVDNIKPIAKSTARKGSGGLIGGFGALFDLKPLNYKDPILVSATDGVGTKLKIAIESRVHNSVGIDLVAMCVNDLIVQGAEPLFFLDYYATSKLEANLATEVIKGIAEGCLQAGCALIGGETAEMPGMYRDNDYDLAGFAVGVVEREDILPKNNIMAGDVILGIESSGLHSNGFSLVRTILGQHNISLTDDFNGKNFASELLTPTKIYIKSTKSALKTGKIKALAHITGGGLLENIPRILPSNVTARIIYDSWPRQEIFKWISQFVELAEMQRTFNCGVGMIAITAQEDADIILKMINDEGVKAYTIGEIIKFNNQAITIE
jgi:phosphoribosylformylglycinamidine cyclo-ligase